MLRNGVETERAGGRPATLSVDRARRSGNVLTEAGEGIAVLPHLDGGGLDRRGRDGAGRRRRDFGRRLELRLSDLCQVDRGLQERDRRRRGLSLGRLGRWHPAGPEQGDHLRRVRHAARRPRAGGQWPDPVPDRGGRRRGGDQCRRVQVRRADPRRRHPGSGSFSARSDRGTTPRSASSIPMPSCRRRPSWWCAAPTAPAPPSRSPIISAR